MLFLFILLFSIKTYSEPCSLPNCQEVQSYREKSLNNALLTESCPLKLDSLSPEMQIKTMNKIVNQQQEKFEECVDTILKIFKEKRHNDFQLIDNEIKKIGLLSLDKKSQIKAFESLFMPGYLYEFLSGVKPGKGLTYLYFNKQGPMTLMRASLTGSIEQDKVSQPMYKRPGYEVLNEKVSPIQYLLDQVKGSDYFIGLSSQENNFLPGISKVILFELIRNHYLSNKNIKGFQDFAKKMQIGIKVPSQEFKNDTDRLKFEYITHDGYFLSAKSYDFNLSKSNKLPSSMDCSAFIQYCAFGEGSFEDRDAFKVPMEGKFKLVTSDFLDVATQFPREGIRAENAQAIIKKHFNLEKIVCETQLKYGDIIVYKGHIFIFMKYEKQPDGSILIKTIEAAGNGNRALGVFTRNIYNENCTKFAWKEGVEEELPAFTVRFK
ncbi:MAG: hypothetical protein A2381_01730 [Bdellovibrionales bacterium RIFOXYB1_FULL_37_110]|nr:MAG: hypothetical protein A2417_15785 [Bdellovibrionales bacterium RIFOXYC1_FULL_37_79]OFZ58935.1 MAG: hypothetical protein A2381_01730 [Bdellovibrionales bacterium RIFOXYB1_FULL_37_110]OFZ64619.1 MAG: hypothetical protein A2577_13205 [Bdellovibrionales bacterium RIFOXYD1_FULL_36_51]